MQPHYEAERPSVTFHTESMVASQTRTKQLYLSLDGEAGGEVIANHYGFRAFLLKAIDPFFQKKNVALSSP
jgi:hypothetical protein